MSGSRGRLCAFWTTGRIFARSPAPRAAPSFHRLPLASRSGADVGSWERHLDPVRIRERCRELNSEKMLEVELALLEELFGPGVLSEGGRMAWRRGSLPWEYPLYRYIARGGKRTPWREMVRTLLAPSLREQLDTLT